MLLIMWSMLVLSLPTRNSTARMRAWRALKALGAAVLRDGVYVLPGTEPLRAALDAVAADVRANGGTAQLLQVLPGSDDADDGNFAALFDRSAEYAALLADIHAQHDAIARSQPAALSTPLSGAVAALQKQLDQLQAIDHLPGEASLQAASAMAELQAATIAHLQPDEPSALAGLIERRVSADYLGRRWATRARPWVDRLASAWLIRRFIDPQAHLLWLADVRQCPSDALGFDFDGASFSHVGARVTFEVLLASFELETPALRRLGALVHRLDVGGAPVPEAEGVERVLAGMRAALLDDDALFMAAAGVFEGLWTAFEADAAAIISSTVTDNVTDNVTGKVTGQVGHGGSKT